MDSLFGKIELLNDTVYNAGNISKLIIRYTVGRYGFDESGSIKLLSRIVSDCGQIQMSDPQKDNFLEIKSSNVNCIFTSEGGSDSLYNKVYERPWSKGLTLSVKNTSLNPGDTVDFKVNNWEIQSFTEIKSEIKVLVDPFATGKFFTPEGRCTFLIKSGKCARVRVMYSPYYFGNRFECLVRLEDQYGNVCESLSSTGILTINDLSEKIHFEKGLCLISKIFVEKLKPITISVKYQNVTSVPVIVDKAESDFDHNLYWGDLHGQSDETVGTNNISQYFDYAKNKAFLDFAGHQGNDFQIEDAFWSKIQKVCKKVSGKNFIAIPGYEWSGTTPNGGDRNVIYNSYNNKIIRSADVLLDKRSGKGKIAITATDLFNKLDKKSAVVVSHIGGRYANLDFHDVRFNKLIEVHSDWGTFEWFIKDAMQRKLKVGFVSNSDNHIGRLGAGFPGKLHFNNLGGLTGIYSPKLSLKSIIASLKDRRTIATTGIRMYLNAKLLLNDVRYSIGAELTVKNKNIDGLEYQANIVCPSLIEKIEIFNADHVVKEYNYLEKVQKGQIKITFCGANSKGRNRRFTWKGSIKIPKGASFKYNNFYTQVPYSNNNEILFETTTSGDEKSIVINNFKGSKLSLTVNGEEYSIKLHDSVKWEKTLNDFDAKLSCYKTFQEEKNFDKKNISVSLKDLKLKKGFNAVFYKVTTLNSHLGWTSPIFIDVV